MKIQIKTLEPLFRAIEKYMVAEEDGNSGTVETSVTFYYEKGKGVSVGSFDVPYVLEKHFEMDRLMPPNPSLEAPYDGAENQYNNGYIAANDDCKQVLRNMRDSK